MSGTAEFLNTRPIVEPNALTAAKALETVCALQSGILPYAHFIECRATDETDLVVVELEPELSQKRVHPIRHREKIALEFDRQDKHAPWVYALRDDFPLVPHRNLMGFEIPRSLCIYQEAYRQQKRTWTAPKFIEDIRRWLSLTAAGNLHGEDQALEPVFLNSSIPILVPQSLLDDENEGFQNLIVSGRFEDEQVKAFFARKRTGPIEPWDSGKTLGLLIKLPAQEHGYIRHAPSNLEELDMLAQESGFDLLEAIGRHLLEIRQEENALDYPLVLILLFPKVRQAGGPVERVDQYAFYLTDNLFEIGQGIGLWTRLQGIDGLAILTPRDQALKGAEIKVHLLNLVPQLTRKQAALMNGFTDKTDLAVTAIGAGALGSQATNNLFRSGFGQWTIVDHDLLLPHNLARHALYCIPGYPKAEMLSDCLNLVTPEEPVANYLVADVLDPKPEVAESLNQALREAELILDFSADTSVGRHLAHQDEFSARRISLFLNPQGTDLVCLAEDSNRVIRLDHLDLQYYRAVVTNADLDRHLHAPGRVRYGQSCRDSSFIIPQDHIGALAGIASRTVHNLSNQPNAAISIWRLDPETLSVTSVQIEPLPMLELQLGEWRLITDQSLFQKIFAARSQRLPQETGGVLIGSWDLERKTVYVVDMIPAPADSIERTTLFVRGCQGLAEQVAEIEQKTLWELAYVGEWHSHPDGAACSMSDDDRNILQWLQVHMGAIGLPGLMMIACDNQNLGFFMDGQSTALRMLPEPASVGS